MRPNSHVHIFLQKSIKSTIVQFCNCNNISGTFRIYWNDKFKPKNVLEIPNSSQKVRKKGSLQTKTKIGSEVTCPNYRHMAFPSNHLQWTKASLHYSWFLYVPPLDFWIRCFWKQKSTFDEISHLTGWDNHNLISKAKHDRVQSTLDIKIVKTLQC